MEPLPTGPLPPFSADQTTLRFGPDEEDAFIAAGDELSARFEQGRRSQGLGWVVTAFMELKWRHLDGDLSRWEPEDVEGILLRRRPDKVMLNSDDVDHVVADRHRFVIRRALATPAASHRADVKSSLPSFGRQQSIESREAGM